MRGAPGPGSVFAASGAAPTAVCALLLAAGCRAAPDGGHGPTPVAIRNVTVIPMTPGGETLTAATVVVEGDRITSIDGVRPGSGPPSAAAADEVGERIPPGSDVIDGTGRYLIPGLIEMRARTSKTRGSSLGLYVANGVTTLRDVEDDDEELPRWRDEIETGERLGPRLLLGGRRPESGADLLEPGRDGIERVLEPTLDGLDRAERMGVWRRYATAGTRVVPTLVTFTLSTFPGRARLEALAADSIGDLDPRRPYLSRFLELDWREQADGVDERRADMYRGVWSNRLRDLREMHEAGVDILAGSDAGVIGIFPGWSLHEELRLFVDSLGMTPAEALARATRESAEFLGIADSVGSIAEGRVADLVLLDGDPLEDIGNTRRIAAVLLRGTPYREEDLERILQQVLMAPDQRASDRPREPPAADST